MLWNEIICWYYSYQRTYTWLCYNSLPYLTFISIYVIVIYSWEIGKSDTCINKIGFRFWNSSLAAVAYQMVNYTYLTTTDLVWHITSFGNPSHTRIHTYSYKPTNTWSYKKYAFIEKYFLYKQRSLQITRERKERHMFFSSEA